MSSESEKSPPALTSAEQRELLERILSVATQATLETKRLNRLVASGHQLDARQRMAQMDMADKQDRVMKQLLRLLDANRTPSLTVVQDIPHEDQTQTVFLGQPWWGITVGGKRIPSRWVARGVGIVFVVLCVLMVLLGMGLERAGVKPSQVVKTAAPLVTP
jgi:hypothetical protein